MNMKLFQRILLGIVLILFYQIGYSQQRELQETQRNVPLKAEVGEIVAMSKEVIKDVQVQITESFEVKKRSLTYKYKEGVTYPLRRAKDGYNLYYAHDRLIDGKYGGVGINEDDPDDIIAVLVSPDGDLIKMKKDTLNEKIEMVEKFQVCRECYRKEFKYLGMEGNVLKFSYQKLVGVLNKLSFEEEVTFTYSQGQIIEYKDLKLKVVDATDTFVAYEILQAFNPLK